MKFDQTQKMTSEDYGQLAKLMLKLFSGREGAYAVQDENGAFHHVDGELTDETVLEHIRKGVPLSVYVVKTNSIVQFAAIDVGNKDFNLARNFINRLEHFDIGGILEEPGGKGLNIWVLFRKPINVAKARALMKFMLIEAEMPPKTIIFPQQNDAKNLIKLPLGLDLKHYDPFENSGISYFMGQDFKKILNPLPFLNQVKLVEEKLVDEIFEMNGIVVKASNDQEPKAPAKHTLINNKEISGDKMIKIQESFERLKGQKRTIEKIYDYCDENGVLLYQVVRYKPKSFSQRRPVNEKNFAWGLKAGWYERRKAGGDYYMVESLSDNPSKPPSKHAIRLEKCETTLYRLDSIMKGIDRGEMIFIVEGEKDADALSALGYTVTTSPMGAGKWQNHYTENFKGCKSVVIIADKDVPGRDGAEFAAGQIAGIGVPVIKVVEMPDRNGVIVKDFNDWKDAGGTKEEFDQIIENSPLWQIHESACKAVDGSVSSELVDEFGLPYYKNRFDEVSSLNESYWAAHHFEQHIELYEPIEKAFYRYQEVSGLFLEVTENIIKKEISNNLLQFSRSADLPSLERLRKNATLQNITSQLKGIAEKRDAFVKNQNIVHLGNGVIVFRDTGEADFTKFSPSYYSRNQSPINYDPSARCDRFLGELLNPSTHEEDAIVIQKYAGLCLLGNNLVQRFLILDGGAGKGKTTISDILQKLVGLNNVTELRTKHLDERFELYRYLKKTLLIGIDVPGNFLWQKGGYVIKGLVGGDLYDAEQKCGTASFQLRGKYCIIITSNSRLQVKLDGDLGAWKRRLLIVRFEAPPPVKKIPNFSDLLIREEGSGILNWALKGLAMSLEDIHQHGDIQLGKRQETIVDALLAESDSLRHFLIDCVEANDLSDLSVQELIEAYAEYCPTKGWHAKPVTVIQREIESLMLEFFHTCKSNSIRRDDKWARGFRKVRFKNRRNETWV